MGPIKCRRFDCNKTREGERASERDARNERGRLPRPLVSLVRSFVRVAHE